MNFERFRALGLFFHAPEAMVSGIISAIRKYKFALAAFLLPFTVRAIPEAIAGPYPIGWDIIAFYVPNTLDMAAGRMSVWGIIGSGPLMYSFIVPIYLLTRISPILLFKATGPVLFGLLCWSVFRFCEKKLGLSMRSASKFPPNVEETSWGRSARPILLVRTVTAKPVSKSWCRSLRWPVGSAR